MNLLWIVVIVLLVVALTGAPSLGLWNHGMGWGPTGGVGILVLILLILLLTGRL